MEEKMEDIQNKDSKKDPSIARRGRWIRKPSEFVFADVSIETSINKLDLCERSFKLVLISAMKTAFGDHGLAIPIDVIKFRKEDLRAYLRFPGNQFTKVQCGLTLMSSWNGVDINIIVHKVAHSLPALCVDSFHQEHDIIKEF